jgi:hypothetical protein
VRAHGERNGNAKLTSAQALDVHLLARSKRYFQWQIGEAFGISQSQVSHILWRREWRWLLLENNEEKPMTVGTKDEEFEARLAASEKRVAELERKLAEAGKPPAPFKSNYTRPTNPIDRLGMSKSAVDAVAIDAEMAAGLRSDAFPNAYKSGSPRSPGQPQAERGSGWVDPPKLEPPPGLKYVDAMMDAQDAIDRAEAEWKRRRLSEGK